MLSACGCQPECWTWAKGGQAVGHVRALAEHVGGLRALVLSSNASKGAGLSEVAKVEQGQAGARAAEERKLHWARPSQSLLVCHSNVSISTSTTSNTNRSTAVLLQCIYISMVP